MTLNKADTERHEIPSCVPRLIAGRICFVPLSDLSPEEQEEHRRKIDTAKDGPPAVLTCAPELWQDAEVKNG